MNLLKAIIFIGLAVQLTYAEGDQDVSSNKANEALVIPEGAAEGVAISKRKLESYIADQFDKVSEVTHALFSDDFYAIEIAGWGMLDVFTLSFNIRTTDGIIYEGIQCRVFSRKTELNLDDCENDEVVLSKEEININMNFIVLGKDGDKKYIR